MGIKGKSKRNEEEKEKKRRKERFSNQVGLQHSNSESSTDQGVSSPTLQVVGVSPTRFLFS